jgi:hypothetical protein
MICLQSWSSCLIALNVVAERTMRRRILAIAILSVTTSPAAFAKDLPLMGTQADESGNSATLEIVDQKNTIKVTCETFQIQAWTPSEDDKGDSTSLDCGGVSIDANSPLLWDYANKKQQLEKALLSFKTVKGQSYTIEMPNVLITHLSVLSDSIGINVSAATSRLIVPPRRQ